MIYALPARETPIDQGDIIDECPLLHVAGFNIERILAGDLGSLEIAANFSRVVIVTQTCDLANQKTTMAVVA